MPTPECWQELGTLRAEVDELNRVREEQEKRIRALECEKTRLKTLGGVVAFVFLAIGTFFSEPIKVLAERMFK